MYISQDVFHIAIQRSVADSRGRARAFTIHARTETMRSNTDKPSTAQARGERARLRDPDIRRHAYNRDQTAANVSRRVQTELQKKQTIP